MLILIFTADIATSDVTAPAAKPPVTTTTKCTAVGQPHGHAIPCLGNPNADVATVAGIIEPEARDVATPPEVVQTETVDTTNPPRLLVWKL